MAMLTSSATVWSASLVYWMRLEREGEGWGGRMLVGLTPDLGGNYLPTGVHGLGAVVQLVLTYDCNGANAVCFLPSVTVSRERSENKMMEHTNHQKRKPRQHLFSSSYPFASSIPGAMA